MEWDQSNSKPLQEQLLSGICSTLSVRLCEAGLDEDVLSSLRAAAMAEKALCLAIGRLPDTA